MNKRQFDKVERRGVSEADFKDALKQVLLAPRGEARSETYEPVIEELNQKWRLDRVKPKFTSM
ncbi:MAG: hypothetical protein OXC41_01775 [Gammaproteobacteria bacterium]|nr:hypothetical protein [Gammaproteobacteria bacterium]